MWKYNPDNFKQFLQFLRTIDPSRLLAIAALLFTIFMYPGHNAFQTLMIKPGPVRSYKLPNPELLPYPQSDGVAVPYTSARAVVIQDAVGKHMIYSKSPDTTLLPASITKIMTALVSLDQWSDLETVIEVKNEDRAIGQTIELVRGEKMTLKNMFYGLLVHSGNDAALALADNYPGGYTAFVKAMNAKAKTLHLDHTTFKNPSGVEQYGHITTARDLAVLAAYALQNPLINEIVQTKSITVTDVTGEHLHKLDTTNQLLGQVEGLKGLKTGWTENAGECLVSYVERGERKIIIVVLGSLDRFGDTTRLVNWVYDHHNWITPDL